MDEGGRIHYVVNVEGAVYRDGEYLLAERAPGEDHAAGEIALVGGKVEGVAEAENVVERTVRREVREEVGVEVDTVEYVRSAAFVADDGDHVVNLVCLCRHERGEASVEEPEELAAVRWLSPDAVADHPDVPPYTRTYVEAAERRRRELGW